MQARASLSCLERTIANIPWREEMERFPEYQRCGHGLIQTYVTSEMGDAEITASTGAAENVALLVRVPSARNKHADSLRVALQLQL